MVARLMTALVAFLSFVGGVAGAEVDAVIDDGTRFATKAAKSPEKIYYGKIAVDSKGKLVSQTNLEGLATKDTKVALGTFDEKKKEWVAGEAIEGGITAGMFIDAGKVLRVRVTLADDNKTIRQILVTNTNEKLEHASGEFDAIFKGLGRTNFGGRVAFSYVRIEIDENRRIINHFPLTVSSISNDTKVALGKYNDKDQTWEAGDEIPKGMWGDPFKDPGLKPIYVRITYREDNRGIAQVLLRPASEQPKK